MTDFRATARNVLAMLARAGQQEFEERLPAALTADCVFDVSAPIDRLEGTDAIRVGFWEPLRRAIPHLRRRDEILIGGRNRRAAGGDWVAAITHYVGTLERPLLGVPASGKLVFLRAGEFYRIAGGRIAEARIILDLPDLLRQVGRPPFPPVLGTEMLFPGPATHDGVLPDPAGGERSLDLIEAMISDLHAFDPETLSSHGQTGAGGYWCEDMLWYGPGGIGANYRWDGFVRDHRAPFLRAFPDRRGGDHYCRIGDGAYAAISGWPSMTMTHRGEYLGVPPTGRKLSLRVMDFYRCAGACIAENWVMLDYVDLFRQIGRDIIADAGG
jgi:predicted ester cyclase